MQCVIQKIHDASQAQVLVALREADHRNAGNLTPPSDPQYWKIHPGELPFQLAICNRLLPGAGIKLVSGRVCRSGEGTSMINPAALVPSPLHWSWFAGVTQLGDHQLRAGVDLVLAFLVMRHTFRRGSH